MVWWPIISPAGFGVCAETRVVPSRSRSVVIANILVVVIASSVMVVVASGGVLSTKRRAVDLLGAAAGPLALEILGVLPQSRSDAHHDAALSDSPVVLAGTVLRNAIADPGRR
jgi:hypothetical protein